MSLLRLFARDPPAGADGALELRRGQLLGELEQLLLRVGPGHAGQRPHLGVGELAASEGGAAERQLLQAVRHAHVLARGARAQSALPGEPLRSRAAIPLDPQPLTVELSHQLQPAAHACVQVRGQGDQLLLEGRPRRLGAIVLDAHARGRNGRRQHVSILVALSDNTEARMDDARDGPTRRLRGAPPGSS